MALEGRELERNKVVIEPYGIFGILKPISPEVGFGNIPKILSNKRTVKTPLRVATTVQVKIKTKTATKKPKVDKKKTRKW